MPRSEIDLSPAISAAKEVFWRQGYDDASIEQVVQATGLNRYALYNAFGGKLEIFIAALDSYCAERKNVFLDSLNNLSDSPMRAIESFFEFAINEMAERSAGCLMCDVALEVGRHEKIVSRQVEKYLQEIKCSYIEALRQAEALGDLNPAISPEEGADLLVAIKLGLGVHAKNGAGKQEMLKIFYPVIAVLSRGRVQ